MKVTTEKKSKVWFLPSGVLRDPTEGLCPLREGFATIPDAPTQINRKAQKYAKNTLARRPTVGYS
jgi:hypothetical protein